MGCSNCTRSASGGCEAHKVPQRASIEAALSTVYPTATWGEPSDEPRFGAGISTAEGRRLARALAVATRAPTYHRPGGPDDLCDHIDVLCVGRTPAIVELLDAAQPPPPEADRIRERYLRVSLSTVARLACVQEVAMELDREGELVVVRELPQPGVYDAKLLKRMRAIVDLLQASDIEHLDFGLVDVPWAGARPGEYVARFGVEPTIANFLFFAAPARTAVSTVLSATA